MINKNIVYLISPLIRKYFLSFFFFSLFGLLSSFLFFFLSLTPPSSPSQCFGFAGFVIGRLLRLVFWVLVVGGGSFLGWDWVGVGSLVHGSGGGLNSGWYRGRGLWVAAGGCEWWWLRVLGWTVTIYGVQAWHFGHQILTYFKTLDGEEDRKLLETTHWFKVNMDPVMLEVFNK